MKTYFVYILASQKYGTLYIGVTNDISKRIYEHKSKIIPGFTSQYNVDQLVHIEQYISIISAISREKQLKRWRRQYKIELINQSNPTWSDLSKNLF